MIQTLQTRVSPWMDHLKYSTKLVGSHFLRNFRAKVAIDFDAGEYRVKTAQTSFEVERALRLRYSIFLRELQGKRLPFALDVDRHDFECDHLLIIRQSTGEVVGTYRLLCSLFVDRFYSEGEFRLAPLLSEPHTKLELGRACIHVEHRNGAVMQLLWRGVTEYMKATQARFLFGCSSVQSLEAEKLQDLLNRLDRFDAFDGVAGIEPTAKYHPDVHGMRFLPPNHHFPALSAEDAPLEIPALIVGYLRAGAKLAALPAIDIDFSCVDLFTVLDFQNMNPAFRRRYFE